MTLLEILTPLLKHIGCNLPLRVATQDEIASIERDAPPDEAGALDTLVILDAVVIAESLALGYAEDDRWFVADLRTRPVSFIEGYYSSAPIADEARLLLTPFVYAAMRTRLGWEPADAFSEEEGSSRRSIPPLR